MKPQPPVMMTRISAEVNLSAPATIDDLARAWGMQANVCALANLPP